jgi:DNA repair ATPase RecN
MNFTYFDPQQLFAAREYLDDLKAELSHLQRKKTETESALEKSTVRAEAMKKARVIIQTVAQETQRNLEYHLSYPVTDAIQYVFPDDNIKFIARIVIARGKTECHLLFDENGNEYKPLKGSGYGAVNIACFVLRICFWGLNKNRPTIIVDEPFRDVSPDLHHKVSELIKRISKKLGIQIIIVSHQNDINIAADRTFQVKRVKGVSEINQL